MLQYIYMSPGRFYNIISVISAYTYLEGFWSEGVYPGDLSGGLLFVQRICIITSEIFRVGQNVWYWNIVLLMLMSYFKYTAKSRTGFQVLLVHFFFCGNWPVRMYIIKKKAEFAFCLKIEFGIITLMLLWAHEYWCISWFTSAWATLLTLMRQYD